ncbi:DUF1566 domain-containing protein [Allopusillimonas soli]|uniref:DUF1566 domain-containing protein n=1 Tax=Allopusillimonas soli TaxID=659016 RepID=A0A853FJK1_9BURK|nr:DUF1566 domain-containing protein [Allopusillimonas soli]NYT38910.1 DUF1566 domain-containing protein [Allopusillimonas soli]TEA70092.1 DUF1566 domain-containing protein [Allopusillimonas soli]
MTAATETQIPAIGQPWPEQGGTYVGSLMKDGQLHHLVEPGGVQFDIEDVTFRNAAEAVQAKGEINGHNDWRVPDQRELMLAYINVPGQFDKEDWYWTSAQYSEYLAWAFGFENGNVGNWHKYNEFRVRPFRSIIDSSL